MSARKYLVMCAIVLFGVTGDVSLSRGMKQVGNIALGQLDQLFFALANPWIIGGILLLIIFMASYMAALSWADLTYVLPATAGVGYVLVALLAKFFLHENVSPKRWLGIALITVGVALVTSGPALTTLPDGPNRAPEGALDEGVS